MWPTKSYYLRLFDWLKYRWNPRQKWDRQRHSDIRKDETGYVIWDWLWERVKPSAGGIRKPLADGINNAEKSYASWIKNASIVAKIIAFSVISSLFALFDSDTKETKLLNNVMVYSNVKSTSSLANLVADFFII